MKRSVARRSRSAREGAVLVLLALFAGALLGLAALTVDLGLARLTQAQMQGAADAAALEGLRGRDAPVVDADLLRRESARDLVAWRFDDDLGATPTDALALGAGPIFVLDPGIGPAHASQLLDASASSVHDPLLELNLANELHGDLVAGDPLQPLDPLAVPEDDAYQRTDFATVDLDGNARLDAFLVRLRRTADRQGLDRVGGVSSSGPTLPLLFGKALFLSSDGSGGDPVADGLTLRATAIAAAGDVVDDGGALVATAGLVLRCGPESTVPGAERLGAAPLALSRAFFADTLVVDVPLDLTYDAGGTIAAAGTPVGRFAVVTRVGETVVDAPIPAAVGSAVYLPVVDLVGGRDVCVGFGYATLEAFGAGSITITKREPIVAPENASAHLPEGLALGAAELGELAAARSLFRRWSLRAPVLWR